MKFSAWFKSILEYTASTDFANKTWYHGTWDLEPILQSKRLKTRAEGVRSRNAAALGIGVYISDDLAEAQSYVPANRPGGVVSVTFVGNPKLLRLFNNKEDDALFEQLRNIGLNDSYKVTKMVQDMGFEGVHWDLRSGEQKIALYNPKYLSDIKLAARSVTPPNTLDQTWELER